MRASIVISTHNRHVALEKLLTDLRAQNAPDTDFEVIVVDSREGDDPSGVIERQASLGLRVSLVFAANILAAKRNAGAAVATGEILIFLDDDLEVDVNFVKAHVDAHPDKGYVVSGQIRFPEQWVKRSNYYRYKNSRHLNSSAVANKVQVVTGNHVVAMNCSIHADEYHRVGGFDESFERYGGEDVEFGFRVQRAQLGTLYSPEPIAYHYEIETDVSVFASKIYKAGYYATPLVLERAPEARRVPTIRWTERGYADSLSDRAVYSALVSLNAMNLLPLMIRYLKWGDGKRYLYWTLPYKLLTLAANQLACRDRRTGRGDHTDDLLVGSPREVER